MLGGHMKRERPGFHRLSALSGILVGLFACTGPPEPEPLTAEQVLASEEVIEGLRASLGTLSKSVLNLEFPDAIGRTAFEPEVEVVDLKAPAGDGEDVLDLGLTRRGWSIAASETSSAEDLSLWSDFLKGVDFFHHFNFYNIRGGFEDEERPVSTMTSNRVCIGPSIPCRSSSSFDSYVFDELYFWYAMRSASPICVTPSSSRSNPLRSSTGSIRVIQMSLPPSRA